MSDTKGEEKHVRVVCEDFWEDGILDEYYEQLGKGYINGRRIR